MAEGVGRGEVGFAAAHFRDLLHELHQTIVGGEHEGVDQNSRALALGDFLQRLTHHQRIEAEGVLVDAAVFEGQG